MNDRQMAAKIKQIHEGWKPGSFGFHELLDRLYLFADGFSQSVADHPAANHPKLRKKIKKVERLLFDLYQEAGNCQ